MGMQFKYKDKKWLNCFHNVYGSNKKRYVGQILISCTPLNKIKPEIEIKVAKDLNLVEEHKNETTAVEKNLSEIDIMYNKSKDLEEKRKNSKLNNIDKVTTNFVCLNIIKG